MYIHIYSDKSKMNLVENRKWDFGSNSFRKSFQISRPYIIYFILRNLMVFEVECFPKRRSK